MKKRIRYWDMAKGIAIVLMIIGHSSCPGIIRHFIFSFHMPLFFIASAFFIRSYSVSRNVKSSLRHIVLPFAIGTAVEMVCACFVADDAGQALRNIGTLALDFVGGMSRPSEHFPIFHGVWLLWFLPCLFVCRLIYVAVMHFLEGKKWYFGAAAVLLLTCAGFVLSRWSYMPWEIEIALVCVSFLYAGNMLAKSDLLNNEKLNTKVFWICLAFCAFCLAVLQVNIELAKHEYPYYFLSILEGCAGTYCVVYICKLLEEKRIIEKPLSWLGQNSVVILIVHNAEYRFVPWASVFGPIADKGSYWIVLSITRIVLALSLTALFCEMKYLWTEKLMPRLKPGA